MRKHFEDLTDQEQTDFVKEVQRIYNFGSACLIASAINADRDSKGWPTIRLESTPSNDVEIPLCEILDIIHDSTKLEIANEIMSVPLGALMAMGTNLEALTTHQAMHDAFNLGIAAASLLELDFSGVDDVMDQLKGGSDG